MITIDGIPINELMEVSINRILTAQNEVRYIIDYVKRNVNDIDPNLLQEINEDFTTLKNTSARLLSYLTLINPKHKVKL